MSGGGGVPEGATPLMLACQSGDVDNVTKLIQKDIPLRARDSSGKTALHYCVENDGPTVSEMLLRKDPLMLEIKDDDGHSPLQLATIAGNRTIIEHLIDHNADVMTRDNEGHTPAHWATVCGHASLVDYLEDYGADLSTPDSHQAYPIHYAAQMCGASTDVHRKSGLNLLQKFVDKGLPIDVQDKDNRQPLLWAASAGSPEGIEVLTRAGAELEATDKDGLTALHCSASKGYKSCIDILKEKGANVNCVDKNGCTPIFYSITLNRKECTKRLLDVGADPSHQDDKGRTPAHCAAAKGSIESVKMLQTKDADVWQQNRRGEYPIHEAALARKTDTVDYLFTKNSEKLDLTNSDGRTCLHIAALTNNLKLCKKLVARGATINPKMKGRDKELTPYDAAELRGSKECADYLRKNGATPAEKIVPEEQKDDPSDEKAKEEKIDEEKEGTSDEKTEDEEKRKDSEDNAKLEEKDTAKGEERVVKSSPEDVKEEGTKNDEPENKIEEKSDVVTEHQPKEPEPPEAAETKPSEGELGNVQEDPKEPKDIEPANEDKAELAVVAAAKPSEKEGKDKKKKSPGESKTPDLKKKGKKKETHEDKAPEKKTKKEEKGKSAGKDEQKPKNENKKKETSKQGKEAEPQAKKQKTKSTEPKPGKEAKVKEKDKKAEVVAAATAAKVSGKAKTEERPKLDEALEEQIGENRDMPEVRSEEPQTLMPDNAEKSTEAPDVQASSQAIPKTTEKPAVPEKAPETQEKPGAPEEAHKTAEKRSVPEAEEVLRTTEKPVAPGQATETAEKASVPDEAPQTTEKHVVPEQAPETEKPVVPEQAPETENPVVPEQALETVNPVVPGQAPETVNPVVPGQAPDKSEKPAVSEETHEPTEKPGVSEKAPETAEMPAVPEQTPQTTEKPTVSKEALQTTEDPVVPGQAPDKTEKPAVSEETHETKEKPEVSEKAPETPERPVANEQAPETGEKLVAPEQAPETAEHPSAPEKTPKTAEIPSVPSEASDPSEKTVIPEDEPTPTNPPPIVPVPIPIKEAESTPDGQVEKETKKKKKKEETETPKEKVKKTKGTEKKSEKKTSEPPQKERKKDDFDYNAPDSDHKVDTWNKGYKRKEEESQQGPDYTKPKGKSKVDTGDGNYERNKKEKDETPKKKGAGKDNKTQKEKQGTKEKSQDKPKAQKGKSTGKESGDVGEKPVSKEAIAPSVATANVVAGQKKKTKHADKPEQEAAPENSKNKKGSTGGKETKSLGKGNKTEKKKPAKTDGVSKAATENTKKGEDAGDSTVKSKPSESDEPQTRTQDADTRMRTQEDKSAEKTAAGQSINQDVERTTDAPMETKDKTSEKTKERSLESEPASESKKENTVLGSDVMGLTGQGREPAKEQFREENAVGTDKKSEGTGRQTSGEEENTDFGNPEKDSVEEQPSVQEKKNDAIPQNTSGIEAEKDHIKGNNTSDTGQKTKDSPRGDSKNIGHTTLTPLEGDDQEVSGGQPTENHTQSASSEMAAFGAAPAAAAVLAGTAASRDVSSTAEKESKNHPGTNMDGSEKEPGSEIPSQKESEERKADDKVNKDVNDSETHGSKTKRKGVVKEKKSKNKGKGSNDMEGPSKKDVNQTKRENQDNTSSTPPATGTVKKGKDAGKKSNDGSVKKVTQTKDSIEKDSSNDPESVSAKDNGVAQRTPRKDTSIMDNVELKHSESLKENDASEMAEKGKDDDREVVKDIETTNGESFKGEDGEKPTPEVHRDSGHEEPSAETVVVATAAAQKKESNGHTTSTSPAAGTGKKEKDAGGKGKDGSVKKNTQTKDSIERDSSNDPESVSAKDNGVAQRTPGKNTSTMDNVELKHSDSLKENDASEMAEKGKDDDREDVKEIETTNSTSASPATGTGKQEKGAGGKGKDGSVKKNTQTKDSIEKDSSNDPKSVSAKDNGVAQRMPGKNTSSMDNAELKDSENIKENDASETDEEGKDDDREVVTKIEPANQASKGVRFKGDDGEKPPPEVHRDSDPEEPSAETVAPPSAALTGATVGTAISLSTKKESKKRARSKGKGPVGKVGNEQRILENEAGPQDFPEDQTMGVTGKTPYNQDNADVFSSSSKANRKGLPPQSKDTNEDSRDKDRTVCDDIMDESDDDDTVGAAAGGDAPTYVGSGQGSEAQTTARTDHDYEDDFEPEGSEAQTTARRDHDYEDDFEPEEPSTDRSVNRTSTALDQYNRSKPKPVEREMTLIESVKKQQRHPQNSKSSEQKKKVKQKPQKSESRKQMTLAPIPVLLPLPTSLSEPSVALKNGNEKTNRQSTNPTQGGDKEIQTAEMALAKRRRKQGTTDQEPQHKLRPLIKKETAGQIKNKNEEDMSNILPQSKARNEDEPTLQERLDRILMKGKERARGRTRDQSTERPEEKRRKADTNRLVLNQGENDLFKAKHKRRERTKLGFDYNSPDGRTKVDTWNNFKRQGWEPNESKPYHRPEGKSKLDTGRSERWRRAEGETSDQWAQRQPLPREKEKTPTEDDTRPTTMATSNPREEIESVNKKQSKKSDTRPKSVLDNVRERQHVDDQDWVDVKPVKRRKDLPKVERRTLKNEIQELVRIFETKTTALSGINRSRKLTLYHSYRGGMTERKLVNYLKNDYNTGSREKTRGDFEHVQDWERYLAEVVAQADADERAMRTGRQDEPERRGKFDGDSIESSTPRFNPLASRESLNSFWSTILKQEKAQGLGLLKDQRRGQPGNVEKVGKLNRAYGPVMPPDVNSLRSNTSLNLSKSGRRRRRRRRITGPVRSKTMFHMKSSGEPVAGGGREVESRGTDRDTPSTLPYLDSDSGHTGRKVKSYSDGKHRSGFVGSKQRHHPKIAGTPDTDHDGLLQLMDPCPVPPFKWDKPRRPEWEDIQNRQLHRAYITPVVPEDWMTFVQRPEAVRAVSRSESLQQEARDVKEAIGFLNSRISTFRSTVSGPGGSSVGASAPSRDSSFWTTVASRDSHGHMPPKAPVTGLHHRRQRRKSSRRAFGEVGGRHGTLDWGDERPQRHPARIPHIVAENDGVAVASRPPKYRGPFKARCGSRASMGSPRPSDDRPTSTDGQRHSTPQIHGTRLLPDLDVSSPLVRQQQFTPHDDDGWVTDREGVVGGNTAPELSVTKRRQTRRRRRQRTRDRARRLAATADKTALTVEETPEEEEEDRYWRRERDRRSRDYHSSRATSALQLSDTERDGTSGAPVTGRTVSTMSSMNIDIPNDSLDDSTSVAWSHRPSHVVTKPPHGPSTDRTHPDRRGWRGERDQAGPDQDRMGPGGGEDGAPRGRPLVEPDWSQSTDWEDEDYSDIYRAGTADSRASRDYYKDLDPTKKRRLKAKKSILYKQLHANKSKNRYAKLH